MAYYYSPFRAAYQTATLAGCPFCNEANITTQIITNRDNTPFQNEHYRWVVNTYPKFEGHTMLIPRAHLTDLTDETDEAILARQQLLNEVLSVIKRAYPKSGIEYFLQTGVGSASSVAHLHWHLVPAHPDDDLRSFEKLGHFYTTEPKQKKVVIFPKRITMSPDALLAYLRKHS